MPMHHKRRAPFRATRLALLTLLFGLGMGCTQEGDTTIVVDGLDCGLIRNDLIGDWTVSFVPAGTTLVNCEDVPSSDGTLVDVTAGPVTYSNVSVIASASSTSFLVLSGGANRSDELVGSVEADSCLALVQIWENDDGAWMQCIGTFDRTNGTIQAVCDSADLDTPGGLVACDLNTSLFVDILVP